MIEIEKPKIETVDVNDDGTYGKFVVEPLERGYGTTLETRFAESCSRHCRVRQCLRFKSMAFCMNLLQFLA